jgi:uncharacterized protein involved in response to NO
LAELTMQAEGRTIFVGDQTADRTMPQFVLRQRVSIETAYDHDKLARIAMATMQKLRAYQGPALFSHGFRPFFLFGAIYAGAMVPLWLVAFAGDIALPTAFAPRDWHVHEMLFGYVSAVIAGFLLTAIPNWTGRLPIQGGPLAILFAAWLAGRLAVIFSGLIGWQIALAADAAFLLLLAAAAVREIVAGRTWNNLKVVGIISLLAATNVAFHVEAHLDGVAEYSTRAGIALVVTLVCVIGGRIVPSFTRNWLARREPGRLPVPFGRFDAIAMAAGVFAMIAWVVTPSGRLVAGALGVAGLLHIVRLARWAGYRTVSDRLVLVLHVAYAFVPAGFLLAALSALDVVAPSAGIHAWTGGAIGSMTIGVMTRASLGHTGQALSASVATQYVYALIVVAALARVCAALEPAHSSLLLMVAGAAWGAAFLGFALAYAPLLCRTRKF